MNDELVRVTGLTVRFGHSETPAVADVSFTIRSGQRLGLIGESGSGKSVTALSIMGLLPQQARLDGSIRLRGRELVGLPDADYAGVRGEEMSMVFQEPMTALDPTMTVGRQVAEVLRLHHARARRRRRGVTRPGGETDQTAMAAAEPASGTPARQRVVQILGEVGLAEPERIADSYPHQLSGGQRQRCLIAMAVINRPALVMCDEPTTALDVTVQARVLALLNQELDAVGAACLFISHDLAVVSQICDEVLVMYHGRIVERGTVADVLDAPQHPYTRGLVATARIEDVPPGRRLPVLEDFLDGADD